MTLFSISQYLFALNEYDCVGGKLSCHLSSMKDNEWVACINGHGNLYLVFKMRYIIQCYIKRRYLWF